MLEIRHSNTTRDAYNQLYQDTDLLMRDSFYLWLLELLHPQPDSTLLDISCGQGRLVQLAAQQGVWAMGVDFSSAGLLKGAQHTPEAGWLVGDGEQLPLPAMSVEYVMHIGSLEHYEHPQQGAYEIARVLKPNGRACILLPNAFGLFGNIRRVWQTGEIFDDGQPLQRYATRRTWETLLGNGGLIIEHVIAFGEVNRPRTAKDWVWMLQRPQKFVRGVLAYLIPVNLTNHFVFICRPSASLHPDPMLPTP